MKPIRRQRLLTFCAVVIVFMLYRVVQNSWDDSNTYAGLRTEYEKPPTAVQPPPGEEVEDDSLLVERPRPAPDSIEEKLPLHDENEPLGSNQGQDSASESEFDKESVAKLADELGWNKATLSESHEDIEALLEESLETDQHATQDVEKEDKLTAGSASADEKEKLLTPSKTTEDSSDELDIKWKNPPNSDRDKGVLDSTKKAKDGEKKRIHWKPFPEHFPLPEESITPLPSSKAKDIPKVQAVFGQESEAQRTTRTDRLQRVKTEISRTWNAYREHAWMHDELRPVTGETKDPFCGWAATLVDSLDTLWIAGLEDEFDEAARAVGTIDFTTTDRQNIPVFETTIRYLGGLLGAYDVSGNRYQVLLDKAVELAEILMGIFDTPNRMPVLYYEWRPAQASQPHRAYRAGIAELATLSMEFTRLAQLTQKNKYYDAIDRITNNLVEMQQIGTTIPGLFPEALDISGCERTPGSNHFDLSRAAQDQVEAETELDEPEGYVAQQQAKRGAEDESTGDVDESEGSQSGDAALHKRTNSKYIHDTLSHKADTDGGVKAPSAETEDRSESARQRQPPLAADGRTSEWDCKPKPFTPASSGRQNFHMGGAQDSAYEYFPKEYLLLGGHEPKYQKLYEDAIGAINDWMLYRPMANDEDDWDVLFPAKVITYGKFPQDAVADFQATHLTCFIGGMYGLGGKIFGREEDVETAKKLTDGCVWAYQLTRSGLMPEQASMLECPTLEKCEFNETKWYERLDVHYADRDADVLAWEIEEERLEAERLQKEAVTHEADQRGQPGTYNSEKKEEAQQLENVALEHDLNAVGTVVGDDHSLSKRATIPKVDEKLLSETESELPDSLKKKLGLEIKEDAFEATKTTADDGTGAKSKDKAQALAKDQSDPPPNSVPKYSAPERMTGAHRRTKPLTHKEYVERRIKNEGLPRGFTEMQARGYILRPEAIESVWYMYRITGDPTWMDKGWAMFQATVRATRTSMANSAVLDVTDEVPQVVNSMESFWLAETLKYYYLLFSEPDVISLDEWVLNTEAHPFKRPT